MGIVEYTSALGSVPVPSILWEGGDLLIAGENTSLGSLAQHVEDGGRHVPYHPLQDVQTLA